MVKKQIGINLRSALKFATLGKNIKLDMLVSDNKIITIEI